MDIIRFEESFDRRQNAVERRKAGQFYTRRSTRIKLCGVRKEVKLKTPRKKKTKTTDKSIRRPSYLRPVKKPKKNQEMGKSDRFKKRSKDRRDKLQYQTWFEGDAEE
jgi:hypothetical protein